MSSFRLRGSLVLVTIAWLNSNAAGFLFWPSDKPSNPCNLSPCRNGVSKCEETNVFPNYKCTNIKSGLPEANPRPAMVLSLDGGGSKGIMEVKMLQDVMKTLSLLVRAPANLTRHLGLANVGERQSYRKLLDVGPINDLDDHGETEIIHPTAVFDMIAGTSTGGLIAFALVGGDKAKDGSRTPLNVTGVIEMYNDFTSSIFKPNNPDEDQCFEFCNSVSMEDIIFVCKELEANEILAQIVAKVLPEFGWTMADVKSKCSLIIKVGHWLPGIASAVVKRKIKMICNRLCEESGLKNISAPYDNDGLKLQLKHAFGDTTLNQISKNVPSSIALAVTTPVSLNAKTFYNNMLQLNFKNLVHTSFDTFMSKKDASANVLVKDVLLATSAAPTYLPIPIHIRSYADEDGFGYIDGGVGANCPLRLALRRIGQIMNKDQTDKVAVISIAPPRSSTCARNVTTMLENMITDGYAVYECVKDEYPSALLQRLAPLSKVLQDYDMADNHTEKMVADLMTESINDFRYFNGIQEAAAIILASHYTVADERLKDGPKAAEVLLDVYLNSYTNCADHLKAINFAKQILEFLLVPPGNIDLETLKSRKSFHSKFCKFIRAAEKCVIPISKEKKLMDHLVNLNNNLCY